MTEFDRQFFAVIPVHGSFGVIESEGIEEIKKGVKEFLEVPRKSYPNYDFEEHIVLIYGRKIEWEKDEK